MKKCNSCGSIKTLDSFNNRKKNKDGKRSTCRLCEHEYDRNYRKTKEGVIVTMYNTQRSSSKKRGHGEPKYSLTELKQNLLNDELFDKIFNEWVKSNYNRWMKPSLDRIDESKGYSFDNVKLMTWGENDFNQKEDLRSGKTIHGNKPHKPVLQYSKDGEFLNEFVSAMDAYRKTGISNKNISDNCLGRLKSANGFVWKFKNG